jgi:hypothetical protein
MNVSDLNPHLLKQILKTSEGFPAQVTTGIGHPIGAHVRGAAATEYKTQFCSLNDQVDALWMFLNTAEGGAALSALTPGTRQVAKGTIKQLFPIAVTIPGTGSVRFTTQEQAAAGFSATNCVAVLEGRERAGRMHLHVQTFYPKTEVGSLLARRATP